MTAFQDMEREGWDKRAGGYRDLFGAITSQGVGSLLDALGRLEGCDFLDIACGTGEVADAARRRGARAQGVDFSEKMVIHAREKFPAVEFRRGEAQELPFAESSFDAAACGFGLPYFADPGQALISARRMLRPGGRFALTTWCGPAQGGEFFAFVDQMLAEHGVAEVGLPARPPMFRLGDPEECHRCLVKAGFDVSRIEVVDLVWSTFSPRAIPEMIDASMIWTSNALQRQRPEVRDSIARAIDVAGERKRKDGKIAFRLPALLAVASLR
jgi:SAM-dependent methyltransferase